MRRIVILGGGTRGTLTANRLRHSYDEQAAEIVVVDLDADHVYQPGLQSVPFGLTDMRRITRPRPLAFQQFYLHSLLPGRDIPGIGSAMPVRGKILPVDQATTSGHR